MLNILVPFNVPGKRRAFFFNKQVANFWLTDKECCSINSEG